MTNDNGGTYEALAEALSHAADGDRLRLSPGIHAAVATIERNVEIYAATAAVTGDVPAILRLMAALR